MYIILFHFDTLSNADYYNTLMTGRQEFYGSSGGNQLMLLRQLEKALPKKGL